MSGCAFRFCGMAVQVSVARTGHDIRTASRRHRLRPIELWNSPQFKRWVNKGAKGIALIDDSGDWTRLRYVFDVSDTHTRSNIPFALWQLHEKDEERVLEELANRFGEIDEYAELPFPIS